MRYIGNKENILDNIYQIFQKNGVKGKSFFDFFAGTTNVGRYFKKLGYQIYCSDVMYLSYCLQKAYIENNQEPQFEKLLAKLPEIQSDSLFLSALEKVIVYLNSIEPLDGFIYKNYTPDGTSNLEQPRMYFSSENGQKIDAIRTKIEEWKNANLIFDNEYFILLSCLIETVSFYANVAGVYAAFQKKWDPRAIKPLVLRAIETVNNSHQNFVYNTNSLDLVPNINVDILYLDPPYNARQYLPNYHLIETIAKYDKPTIKGITGMRNYENKKSSFCNAKTALQGLDYIAANANYKYLVLSYNSEGIMKQEDIVSTLSKYGTVKLEQFEYLRFKSNNNGLAKTKKHVFEQLYILKNE
jgi:adenine-specific DNA-methyltransferase